MISTALIPRFCRLLESGALDAYSATDVRRLVDLAEQVEASVERQSLKFEMLLKSAYTVFAAAVAATEASLSPFLELNQPRFDPAAIPARRRFLTRRYKLLRNLLQWRRYAGDKYGLGALATRLVTSSMLPVAETGWEVGGEEIIRKVRLRARVYQPRRKWLTIRSMIRLHKHCPQSSFRRRCRICCDRHEDRLYATIIS